MQNYLLVFLGGGLGSVARFGIGQSLAAARLQFPWATFLANTASCLLLGLLLGWSLKGRLGGAAAVFFTAGFCGGFSTFSTFTGETFQLLAGGHFFKAAANILLSLLACLLALYAGLKIAA